MPLLPSFCLIYAKYRFGEAFYHYYLDSIWLHCNFRAQQILYFIRGTHSTEHIRHTCRSSLIAKEVELPEKRDHTHSYTDHSCQEGEVVKWGQETCITGESRHDTAIFVAQGDRELGCVGVEQVLRDCRVSHYQQHHQEVHT